MSINNVFTGYENCSIEDMTDILYNYLKSNGKELNAHFNGLYNCLEYIKACSTNPFNNDYFREFIDCMSLVCETIKENQ